MAQEIEQLLKVFAEVIGKMPDTALYILFGFFIFKMTFLLAPSWGIYRIIRLVVEKIHDAKVRPTEIITKVSIDDKFICHDGTLDKFYQLLSRVQYHRNGDKFSSKYLHKSDVEWLEAIVNKKINEENKSKES